MGEWMCAEFRFSFNRRVGMGGGTIETVHHMVQKKLLEISDQFDFKHFFGLPKYKLV